MNQFRFFEGGGRFVPRLDGRKEFLVRIFQRMEAQRLQCFKEVLFSIQKCLNLSEDPE
jgi:hypothetical protein